MLFRGLLSPAETDHIHFWEVAKANGQLITAGILGQVMVVTGIGVEVATGALCSLLPRRTRGCPQFALSRLYR